MSLVAVAVAALAGVVLALVVHEGGHALAAWLVGARRIRAEWTARGPAVSAEIDSSPNAGRARTVASLLGGSVANVAVAAACVAAAGAFEGARGAFDVVIVVSVVCAAVNLVPHGTSDGARVLALWAARNDDAVSVR